MDLSISQIIYLNAVLIAASVNDFRYQKIPNLLTYPAMVLGVGFWTLTRGTEGLFFSIEGLGLGLGIMVLPYLFGAMGAGDVKLMAAVGSMLGPRGVAIALLFTAIAGGIYALTMLFFSPETLKRYGRVSKTLITTGQLVWIPEKEGERKPKLSYGIAIAAGTLVSILWQRYGMPFPI